MLDLDLKAPNCTSFKVTFLISAYREMYSHWRATPASPSSLDWTATQQHSAQYHSGKMSAFLSHFGTVHWQLFGWLVWRQFVRSVHHHWVCRGKHISARWWQFVWWGRRCWRERWNIVKTVRPSLKHNGRHFADNIGKCQHHVHRCSGNCHCKIISRNNDEILSRNNYSLFFFVFFCIYMYCIHISFLQLIHVFHYKV